MSSTIPLFRQEQKKTMKRPVHRLEVFSMRFSNKKFCKHRESSITWDYDFKYVDPLCDVFRNAKLPDFFTGRIFIADSLKFQEIYNSKKSVSLYADVPKRRKRKFGHTDLPVTDEEGTSQNSADSEETDLPGINEDEMQDSADLPLMGPEVAMVIDQDGFKVILHPDCGQDDAELKYYDYAKSRYLTRREPPIPNDNVGFFHVYLDTPTSPRKFDNPFEFTVATPYGPLTLDCIMFRSSKAVYLNVKWIKEGGDVTDIYVCGRLFVVNDKFQDNESVLFDTPPNKAIKAPGGDIPLLRSVVAAPYTSWVKVEAELCCSYSIDGEFHQIVDDIAVFPYIDHDDDACESSTSFMPDYPLNWLPPARPIIYESKKVIPGYGGTLVVTAYVDIK